MTFGRVLPPRLGGLLVLPAYPSFRGVVATVGLQAGGTTCRLRLYACFQHRHRHYRNIYYRLVDRILA